MRISRYTIHVCIHIYAAAQWYRLQKLIAVIVEVVEVPKVEEAIEVLGKAKVGEMVEDFF